MSQLYVVINSNDISDKIQTGTLSIYKRVTSNPKTASFTLENPDTAPSYGNTVSIYLDSTTYKLFSGFIISIELEILAPQSGGYLYKYNCSCTDYQRCLTKRLVAETYVAGTTIEDVVDDIITNYTYGITTNNVSSIFPLQDDLVIKYKLVVDALRDLANMINCDFYIDDDRDLHFFWKETSYAPLEINDTTISNNFDNFRLRVDYSQCRNKIFVQGGYTLSDEKTFSYICDGTQTSWSLPYKPHDLTVKLNGITQTLGQENIDTDDGTYEYMYNAYEKTVKCGSSEAAPAQGVTIAFLMKYEHPVLVRVSDQTSIDNITAAENEDGTYEYLLRDNTLELRSQADAVGKYELDKYKNPKVYCSVTIIDYYGFEVGQTITLNLTDNSYNGNYLIQQINISDLGNNLLQYEIEFEGDLDV